MDSLAPMPRNPRRHNDSRNKPSARSCRARSKYMSTFRHEISWTSANTLSVARL